ncbi:MAG TPA: hypothetical protein VGO13_01295 [Solirubrobacterales bacterium]|jgi:hypothetical protein|nr:hypothetical protein [Solirubrobacterales bacterium]
MPRGDPVDGVGIVRYPDAVPSQLVPESYRPRARGRGWRGERGDALLQLLGTADQRLPDPLAALGVERREDLAAAGVEQRQALPLDPGLPDPAPDRVERGDAGRRQAEAGAEAARGGDADPQPGEGAGAEADGEQVDPLPTAGRRGAALDLLQQRGRVPGTPLGGPQQRLVQNLAVPPGAGGGVGGRGVEADDDQRRTVSSP